METVLITGASKGIGLTLAQTLQQRGYRVFGTSRTPETASSQAFRLIPLEITKRESIQACIEAIIVEAGKIDVLINNAGYDLYGAAEETSIEEFDRQLHTNFTGAVNVTRTVLPYMRQQGGGKIINLSSIGGLISLPYNSAYAASKFALEGYSESLRYELLQHHIYVSLIEPSSVRTNTLDTSIQSIVNDHPAYAVQRKLMIEHMRQVGHHSAILPSHIVQTVQQILKTSRPHLRYPVGRQARLIPLLKALLPQSLFESFVIRQFMSGGQ